MNTVKKKNWISLLLIIFMIFSGIGFELSQTDASFLRTLLSEDSCVESGHALTQEAEAHSFHTSRSVWINRDAYAEELISTRTFSGSVIESERTGSKSDGRKANQLSLSGFLTRRSVFTSEMARAEASIESALSSVAIVTYIHQKDGKKS